MEVYLLDRHPFTVASVRGRVVTDGEGVADVAITLRPLGGTDAIERAVTDARGEFALGEVPDGWYQIETCSEAFNSVIVPVHVVRRSRSSDVVELRIKPAA